MEESDQFEVQVQRAFKRMKLSSAASSINSLVESNSTDDRLHCAAESTTQPESLACCSVFRRGVEKENSASNQIRQENKTTETTTSTAATATTRTRHSSCPDRVESQAEDAKSSDIIARPLSPTLLLPDDTVELALRLGQTVTFNSSAEALATFSVEENQEQGPGDDRRRTRGLKRHTTTTCSDQARLDVEMSVDELAGYFEEQLQIPRKMSFMAELMYT